VAVRVEQTRAASEGEAGGRYVPSASLHRFALATAAATLLLIVAGALVVGNDAGLAVPDWPLSYGTWMPPMVGGIFYEHGHRMIAFLVGLLTVVLAVWTWRAERRSWMRWLGIAAVAAVIAQAVLGGITVLYLLPVPVLIAHACLAQSFFCLILGFVVWTSESWHRPAVSRHSGTAKFRTLTALTFAAVYVQLILGAALRHRAIDVVPHLVWAGVVTFMVGYTVFSATRHLPEEPPLQRLAIILGVLVVLQLSLGAMSYFARAAHASAPQPMPEVIWTTTAHVAIGALVLGTSWILSLLAYRRLAPGRAAAWSERAQKSLA